MKSSKPQLLQVVVSAMAIETLLAFNVALIAAIVSPGPASLMAVKTTLSSGPRAGIAMGCGLGLMASLWTLLALLGLESVFMVFPWAYMAAKIAGAVYLLYIAWRMWIGASKPIEASAQSTAHAFRQGFFVNLLNPKSVLFAAAVLIVIFPRNMDWLENTIIVLNHFLIEIAFYAVLATGLSTPAITRKYLRAKIYLDRGAAVVLGALGLRLLSNR